MNAPPLRRRALTVLRVRVRPGHKTHGILVAGHVAVPVVLGRGGVRANKFEGDGATPRGRFRLLRLWWRADRHPRPRTLLPVRRITRDVAWCENTADRRYNRPFRRAAAEPGSAPRIAGRGSAVFLHLARPNWSPTAGCVAFRADDLQRLLTRLGPTTRIAIQL